MNTSPSYPALAEFGQNLVLKLAVPAIAQGYCELVQDLRANKTLVELAAQQGIDAVLSGDSEALASLRKNNRELVTSAEKEAEKLMTQAVQEAFPDHAIIGEEWGVTPGKDITWVFDPVDGTSAMIKHAMAEAFSIALEQPAPSFGITVAVVAGNEAVAGIITELQPHAGTLHADSTWKVVKGSALQRPPTSPAPDITHAILSCTVPQVMFNTFEKWSGFQALADATHTCITGQNCIGFMKLLEGSVHIAYEADLAYHDAAALVPILEGAGIRVTDAKGEALHFPEASIGQEFTVLAALPALHAQALSLIKKGVSPKKNRFALCSKTDSGYANKFPLK